MANPSLFPKFILDSKVGPLRRHHPLYLRAPPLPPLLALMTPSRRRFGEGGGGGGTPYPAATDQRTMRMEGGHSRSRMKEKGGKGLLIDGGGKVMIALLLFRPTERKKYEGGKRGETSFRYLLSEKN